MTRLAAALWLVLALTAPAAAYERIAVRDGGRLTGIVQFVGAAPKVLPLDVRKHADVCGERKQSERLVLGADGGVKESVVLIEGVREGKKPEGEIVLEVRDCQFVPHVSAVMVGERARVRNGDAVLHNPHAFLGSAPVFNLALPRKGQEIDITKRLEGPGVVRLGCGVHAHMSGWIVVHDSPYFAVTDERGAFEIADIPPGSYRVRMWHEPFRPDGQSPRAAVMRVRIAPNATTTLDFELRR